MKRTVVLTLAALAICAGTALAGAPTGITIELRTTADHDKFTGKTSSERARCVPNRRVIIYLVEGAKPNRSIDTPLGDDKTNDNGRYAVIPSGDFAPPGDFYAFAKKTRRCDAAFSGVISHGT